MFRTLAARLTVLLLVAPAALAGSSIKQVPGQAELGTIEIHGVGAGAFDPAIWQAGTLHLVPDARSPLTAPRLAGVFRNIYAPAVVDLPDGGWRVFYGAWDGVPTGNDRIYSLTTRDFLDFADRHMEIDHGAFIHVCNVTAARLPDGSYRLICTAYPVGHDLNKPALFTSPDGVTWNSSPAPYAARREDVITIDGYPGYADADINGMNVILHEAGVDRLYFCNFRAGGHVHRATARPEEPKRFRYEGTCLDTGLLVNDVKKLRAGALWERRPRPDSPGESQRAGTTMWERRPRRDVARPWYLMGLHANGDRLWYALSRDGMKFDPARELARNLGAADRYIVAIGWVVQRRGTLSSPSEAESEPTGPGRESPEARVLASAPAGAAQPGPDRVLGFLYGAGAAPELNRNRLFARWLQKKVVFTTTDGRRFEADAAQGPDRAILNLHGATTLDGRIELYAEDGRTPLGDPQPVHAASGAVYAVRTR